jgi:sugar phosphate isomerase/epimerase
MIDPGRDLIGAEFVELMGRIGFDYAELSLRDVMQLTDREFLGLERRIKASGIRCEACNNFMAFGLRATGGEADQEAVLKYAEAAFARATALGAEIIVFGSPWCRDPELGFDRGAAWAQLVGLLRRMGPPAERFGVVVAMENANRVDTNILNTVDECHRLVRDVGHPNIGILLDYYHLALEKESPDVILAVGGDLSHIHLARLYKRAYPLDSREETDYRALFHNLGKIGYDRRISIEAHTANFVRDAAESLRFLHGFVE